MADPNPSWSLWAGFVEAASIAISALAGGVAVLFGFVWRRGGEIAARSAAAEHVSTKIGALEERVSTIEGRMMSVATTADLASIKVDLGRLLDWALGHERRRE